MDAWLYKALNAKAKAWPYYANDRGKQRRSIRENLETIIDALTCKDAYVSKGLGENALYYQKTAKDGARYGRCTYSGFGDQEIETFKRLGLPVLDLWTADYAKLCKVVIGGPMAAVGDQAVDDKPGALSYRPLREVARGYVAAGATVYNLNLDGCAQSVFEAAGP